VSYDNPYEFEVEEDTELIAIFILNTNVISGFTLPENYGHIEKSDLLFQSFNLWGGCGTHILTAVPIEHPSELYTFEC